MFKIILENHGIKVLQTIDKNTFKVVVNFTSDVISSEEIQIVHFESISELLKWLGY